MQKKTLKTRTSNIHAQHNSTPFTNIFTNYYIRKTQLIWQNLDIHNDKTIYYTHYIFRRNKDKYTGSGKEIAGTGKEKARRPAKKAREPARKMREPARKTRESARHLLPAYLMVTEQLCPARPGPHI